MVALTLANLAASAQTNLPAVKVTAPGYSTEKGGYVISGDFKVDPRMPQVVFPAESLMQGDILSIEPVHLQDDEYLVLQECASAGCRDASLVRFWSSSDLGGDDTRRNRVRITHENKYFIFLARLPEITGKNCGMTPFVGYSQVVTCGSHFTSFQQITPPLVLIPTGDQAMYQKDPLTNFALHDPVKVVTEAHEGSTYVVTYEGGSIVRVRRMHASKAN
jgi:hypothetical protein